DVLLFFFFQAEDGIRDFHVTGVQTCALPISDYAGAYFGCLLAAVDLYGWGSNEVNAVINAFAAIDVASAPASSYPGAAVSQSERSEERRVGKEWRSRWSPEHYKEKKRRDTDT